MSNKRDNFIQLYLEANTSLVKSLTIKLDYAAFAINRKLRREGLIDETPRDPRESKYYMNVTGEYHHTDRPMFVTSLDTRDTILFSKPNLKRHTATAEAYQLGKRHSYMLIREFPEQEALIKGVLYPAEMEHAISAPNGSILSYDPMLVEEHEKTLIIELDAYARRVTKRWYLSAYAITDPYSPVIFMATLGQMLVTELLRLREDRCKTDEVHSFHLREYFASHNELDRFLKFLTREQKLYIYRNIKYIQRNVGNNFMFKELVTEILDKRDIPLTDCSVRQLQNETTDGYPVVTVRKSPITKTVSVGGTNHITLNEFYEKEAGTAPGNPRKFELSQDKITHMLSTTNTSALQTKDLESTVEDLSESVPDPLPEVMMRQWVSLTHQGLYDVYVNFMDPETLEEVSLLSWDAVIYVHYLTLKSKGYEFDTIPPLVVAKYRKHPRPRVEELLKLIIDQPRYAWMAEIAHSLVSAQPTFVQLYSVKEFYDLVHQVYLEHLRHWFLMADVGHPFARAIVEQMIGQLFAVTSFDFSRGEKVEVWRKRLKLPEFKYTAKEVEKLTEEIFAKATGYKTDPTKSIRHIQKALLDMTLELSSYSIQVISESNDSMVYLTGMPDLRTGIDSEYSSDIVAVRDNVRVNDWWGKGADNLTITDTPDDRYLTITQDIKGDDFVVLEDQLVKYLEEDLYCQTRNCNEVFDISVVSVDFVTGASRVLTDDEILSVTPDRAKKLTKFLRNEE